MASHIYLESTSGNALTAVFRQRAGEDERPKAFCMVETEYMVMITGFSKSKEI